ncbi:MAG: DUF4124 domain-containing protein [Proteobacteria bacterium]|uniref:DUF4124 domain-containing protein n=1 Tax=Rudaea sp. TaxID=2136325 RepID=UPI0032207825|nr:DUF4124 domain-containing protein [Pseudomonadota bacterium]
MRSSTFLALTLGLAAVASQYARADDKGLHNRYRWTDAHGVVQYGDVPTAEALQAGYDVVDARGIVVRHVDRVKNADEKKADAAAADASAREKQRVEEIAQADRQLLRAYPSEQALIAAQKGRVVAIDQDLANVKISEANQEKSLAEQLAYASTFERDGKPVPAPVKQQIEVLSKNVAAQKKYTADKLAERAQSEQKAQDELAHYRELRAAQQKAGAD